jgi:diguanylate cyclase (GGDEF)-like protein
VSSSLGKTSIALAAAVLAVFAVLPDGSWEQTLLAVAIGLGVAAAIAFGIRRNRPAGTAPWWLFAAGIASNAIGQLVEAVNGRILHVDTFPSTADIFYLALYPALAAGLALLIARRTSRRQWSRVIETAIITVGLGLLAWVFLVKPVASDPSIGLLGHIVSVAYPVGDVVLIVLLARLLLGSGRQSAAFRLIAVSLGLFLLGDVIWAVLNQLVIEPGLYASRALQINYLLAYLAFGAAALTPSMREVGERRPVDVSRLGPLQLGLLTVVSVIAPGILAIQLWQGEVIDGTAIVAGSIMLSLLVVVRLAQLLRQVESQALQLRELARRDELTGLPNRRRWAEEAPLTLERARRAERPISMALLDLDHFKRFNDRYGHPAGDALLREVATAWNERLRVGDQLARYGGEEFIMLLPDATGEQAAELLQRLGDVMPREQTFSAGVAEWDGSETPDELMARADEALYRAKAEGRDRVAVASQPALRAA